MGAGKSYKSINLLSSSYTCLAEKKNIGISGNFWEVENSSAVWFDIN